MRKYDLQVLFVLVFFFLGEFGIIAIRNHADYFFHDFDQQYDLRHKFKTIDSYTFSFGVFFLMNIDCYTLLTFHACSAQVSNLSFLINVVYKFFESAANVL